MMSNLQLAKDIYAHFARGDIASVLASFDPALEWSEAEGNPYQMDGVAWRGPQEVVEKLFVPLGRDWDGLTIHITTLHDAGDCVVLEGRATGIFKSTGKSYDAQLCHVLHFRAGKLIRHQQYTDTGQLQRVMALE